MAAVRWTVGALRDLRVIVEFIGHDSPTYAAATAGRVVAAVERLERHPKLGRKVPEFDDESIRELIVRNYRVVYRLGERRIGIVAVVHCSQDLLRRLPFAAWIIE